MEKLSSDKAQFQKNTMNMFDLIHTQLRNLCYSAAGLVIGSGSKKRIKQANTVVFTNDGAFKSKSTQEVAFTVTTHDIPANALLDQEAVYLITLAADGTPTLTMGAIASGAGAARLPERPATGTPIGCVRVLVAAGATKFDATSDDLDAGHLTVEYVDLGYYGGRFDSEL